MGMTTIQRHKCAQIIKKASAAGAVTAAGLGLTMIPYASTGPLMAIELVMVVELGDVFGIHLTESAAKGALTAAAANVTGHSIYFIVMGVLDATPAVGPIVGGATAPLVITSLGWAAANYFAKNAT